MSKILEATCNATGVVSAEGVQVLDAIVLSAGKQSSSGLLFIQKDGAWYLTSSATDIASTLEKTADAITKIANLLTAIGAGMTGPTTAPPPTIATDIVAINAVVTQMNALKEALK